MDEANLLIAGFDLSCNSTGVCIINTHRNIVHAESINPYPLGGIERLNYIYNRLYNVLTSYDIGVIGYEKQVPQQRFSYSAGSILPLAEVVGIYKLALYQSGAFSKSEIYAFRPQDLKISLSNDAKADKEKMMESLGTRKLKHLKDNLPEYSVNDCTDAYAAAEAAYYAHKGEFKLEYEKINS